MSVHVVVMLSTDGNRWTRCFAEGRLTPGRSLEWMFRVTPRPFEPTPFSLYGVPVYRERAR